MWKLCHYLKSRHLGLQTFEANHHVGHNLTLNRAPWIQSSTQSLSLGSEISERSVSRSSTDPWNRFQHRYNNIITRWGYAGKVYGSNLLSKWGYEWVVFGCALCTLYCLVVHLMRRSEMPLEISSSESSAPIRLCNNKHIGVNTCVCVCVCVHCIPRMLDWLCHTY